MFTTQKGTLQPDLELARKQRLVVNTAELHRASAVPNPFLVLALQHGICKCQLELELQLHELSLMEKRIDKGLRAAEVPQTKGALMLCVGRRVRTAPRPTQSYQQNLSKLT